MSSLIPEMYVLWHPRCEAGEALATRIYGWLRPGNGLGPQVFYRCLPAPEAPPSGLPPPLPGEQRTSSASPPAPATGSNLQVLILLIDAFMIADPTWRHWIGQLAREQSGANRVCLPVALDATAYNGPVALHALNFLRPTGVPATGTAQPWADDVLETVSRSLLKQLTETLCDLLLRPDDVPTGLAAGPARDLARPKVKIFLSHAKRDGTAPARRIRDYIYSQTQLAAFYDENDIPYGSSFSHVLEGNVSGPTQSAALIAIRSAEYARRPWCRREFSLFRRPLKLPARGRKAEHWLLNPTLVVDALAGGTHTPGMPELGNTASIRWSEDVPAQEEQIVTTVLRDVLLAAFHRTLGETVPDERNHVVLNWLPDPTSLLHIPRVRRARPGLHVYYPGRGLTGLELDTLTDYFPEVEFFSFDRMSS
jgi:hypothetical protein